MDFGRRELGKQKGLEIKQTTRASTATLQAAHCRCCHALVKLGDENSLAAAEHDHFHNSLPLITASLLKVLYPFPL